MGSEMCIRDRYYEIQPKQRQRLEQYRLVPDDPNPAVKKEYKDYRDPFSDDPAGGRFARRWLAAQRPVEIRGHPTGWVVIVQEAYDHAIGRSLNELRGSFVSTGLITLASVAVVIGLLWAFVVRSISGVRPKGAAYRKGGTTPVTPPA